MVSWWASLGTSGDLGWALPWPGLGEAGCEFPHLVPLEGYKV